MKIRAFPTLVVIFIILVALLFVQKKAEQEQYVINEHTFITTSLGDVDKITLRNEKNEMITLSKLGGAWNLTTPMSAGADQAVVENLIDQMKNMKVASSISNNPNKFADYQVEEGKSIHVELFANNQKKEGFFVGKISGRDYSSTYMRKDSDNDVFSIQGMAGQSFSMPVINFRNKTIVSAEDSDISQIIVKSPKDKVTLDMKENAWISTDKNIAKDQINPITTTLKHITAIDYPKDALNKSDIERDFDYKIFYKRSQKDSTSWIVYLKEKDKKLYGYKEGDDEVFSLEPSTIDSLKKVLK